jgi:hypothetical protein
MKFRLSLLSLVLAGANVAAGNLPRAHLHAADELLAHRQEAFASVPYRLDDDGSTVANIDELFYCIAEASTPHYTRSARCPRYFFG